jgi:hypothetical protein
MSRFRRVSTHLFAVLALLAAAPAQAQQQAAPTGGGPAATAVEGGELRLACGGIGLDESLRMRVEGGLHALLILFVSVDGSYLADVATRIDDPLGDRRVEASCGPIGRIDVPVAGRYRITATYGGITQERWMDLKPGGGARMQLRWLE